MKRRIATVFAGVALVLGAAAPSFAAEHHPPKFGVNDNQCTGGSNQPNCPGNH